MMFFLVSISLPASAAAVLMPGTSSVTPKMAQNRTTHAPVQHFTVAADVATSTVQIDTYSATSETEWKKWHDKQIAIAAAKKAAAEAKKAAAAAAKAKAIAAKKAAAAAASAQASAASVSIGAKQTYAFTYMASTYGWTGSDQQTCLLNLWNRESGWSTTAANASGAYGIPQALPGSKMASAGSDWATNYETQIRWGLQYINNSYGSPCNAWAHSNSAGWY